MMINQIILQKHDVWAKKIFKMSKMLLLRFVTYNIEQVAKLKNGYEKYI